MKRSRRDNALIEYGKALGKLIQWREENEYWRKAPLNIKHEYRYGHSFPLLTRDHDLLVRDAWAKRKAYRTFKRRCGSCIHVKWVYPGFGMFNDAYCVKIQERSRNLRLFNCDRAIDCPYYRPKKEEK